MREQKLNFMGWLISSIISFIPVINVIYLLLINFISQTPEHRRWAKAAIIPACIHSIIIILILVRLKNMDYAGYISLYDFFH